MMSIVEEKRLRFANVLKQACNDAQNATVMVVPTFNNLTESVGLLSVDDNNDNTFPYIETNSPSKMLTPSNSPSSQFSNLALISNSAEKNRVDIYESDCEESCTNKSMNSVGKESIRKHDLTLTEEDKEFLGIIGELNVLEDPENAGDVSLYVSTDEKPSVIHCYPEKIPDQDFQDLSAYISKSPDRVYFQTEYLQARSSYATYQPYSSRSKEQSPEEILKKKERNRLRSKAYRLRKKLQFEALRQEVEDAKVAAEIARKEKEFAEEKLGVTENSKCEVNEHK